MGSRSKVGSFARGVTPLSGGGAVLGMWTGGVAWTIWTGAVLGRGKPAVGPATKGMGDGALLFFGGGAWSIAFNRTLCSAINRSILNTSDGGKTCLTRSISSNEVIVFDFFVTDANDLKQQSMWYHRVLGEWP